MGVASGLDQLENLTLNWRFLLAGARPAPPGDSDFYFVPAEVCFGVQN